MLLTTVVLAAGLIGGTAPAHASACAAGWMMNVESFETQSMTWCSEGPMMSGLDVSGMFSRTGTNNAFLQTATPQWNAVKRPVTLPLDPNQSLCFTLTGWFRTMGPVQNGYFGVRTGTSGTVLRETRFGASEGVYRAFTPVRFRSQNLTTVTIFAGHWSPGEFTRVMIDDIQLTWAPAAVCA